MGIDDEFDAILGGDSAAEKKPHPALLQSGVGSGFTSRQASALMIGDGDIDIEAGKRAGVITCGVTYGLGQAKTI